MPSSSDEDEEERSGHGISRKLRVAIKVKLEEMRVKVDPELPDYVIVMISNRKTREEMWEGLRNFIGATQAQEFTKWLHDVVLNRLMAYSKKAKEKLQPNTPPSTSRSGSPSRLSSKVHTTEMAVRRCDKKFLTAPPEYRKPDNYESSYDDNFEQAYYDPYNVLSYSDQERHHYYQRLKSYNNGQYYDQGVKTWQIGERSSIWRPDDNYRQKSSRSTDYGREKSSKATDHNRQKSSDKPKKSSKRVVEEKVETKSSKNSEKWVEKKVGSSSKTLESPPSAEKPRRRTKTEKVSSTREKTSAENHSPEVEEKEKRAGKQLNAESTKTETEATNVEKAEKPEKETRVKKEKKKKKKVAASSSNTKTGEGQEETFGPQVSEPVLKVKEELPEDNEGWNSEDKAEEQRIRESLLKKRESLSTTTEKKKKKRKRHSEETEPHAADNIIEDVIQELNQQTLAIAPKSEPAEGKREKSPKVKRETPRRKSKSKERLTATLPEERVEKTPREKSERRKKEAAKVSPEREELKGLKKKKEEKRRRKEEKQVKMEVEEPTGPDKIGGRDPKLIKIEVKVENAKSEAGKNDTSKKRKILERASPTKPKKIRVEKAAKVKVELKTIKSSSKKAAEKPKEKKKKSEPLLEKTKKSTAEEKEAKVDKEVDKVEKKTKKKLKTVSATSGKSKPKANGAGGLKIRKKTLLEAKKRKVELLAETELFLKEEALKALESESSEGSGVRAKTDLRTELRGLKRRVEFTHTPPVPIGVDEALFVDVDPHTGQSRSDSHVVPSVSSIRPNEQAPGTSATPDPPKTKFTITFGGLDDSFLAKFGSKAKEAVEKPQTLDTVKPAPSSLLIRKIRRLADPGGKIRDKSPAVGRADSSEDSGSGERENERVGETKRRVEAIDTSLDEEEEELDYDDDVEEEREEEEEEGMEVEDVEEERKEEGSISSSREQEEKEEGELVEEEEEEEEEELHLELRLDSDEEEEEKKEEDTRESGINKAVDMCTQTSDDEADCSSSLDGLCGAAEMLAPQNPEPGIEENPAEQEGEEEDFSAQDPPDSPSITVIKDDETNVIIEHHNLILNLSGDSAANLEAIPTVIEEGEGWAGPGPMRREEGAEEDQLPSLDPPPVDKGANEEREEAGGEGKEAESRVDGMTPVETGLRERTMAEKVAAAVASAPSSAAAALAAMKWNVAVKPLSISLEDSDLSDEDDESSERHGTIISSRLSESGSIMSETTAVSSAAHARSRIDISLDAVQVAAPPREKCKFWPNCRLGDKCRYEHPPTTSQGTSGIPCRSFPNCRFGDRCNFVHPICKFDANCTRPRCAFTHPSRNQTGSGVQVSTQNSDAQSLGGQGAGGHQGGGAAPPPTSFPPLPVPCSEGADCTDSECPFNHPKPPCKFGANCSKPSCSFSHPQQLESFGAPQKPKPLVDTTRFKWAPGGRTSSGGGR